jgi:glycosyltransferase involved in cell wall biosynthesis
VAEERRRHFSLTLVDEAARAELDALCGARVVAVSGPLAAWSRVTGAATAVVVPNGADTDGLERGRWERAGAAVRSECGFAESQLVVGFAGSLKPWHGVEVLVEAVREASRGADLGLLVVGDGPRREAVVAAVRTLPAGVQVVLTGAVPPGRVPRYLAAMDMSVAPYLPSEDFYFSPLKVAEAMAVSLPVVASDFLPVRDLLGDTGVLVPPGDVESLARAIWELAVDPYARARHAAAGRSRAVESLDWLAVARRTIEFAHGASERQGVGA